MKKTMQNLIWTLKLAVLHPATLSTPIFLPNNLQMKRPPKLTATQLDRKSDARIKYSYIQCNKPLFFSTFGAIWFLQGESDDDEEAELRAKEREEKKRANQHFGKYKDPALKAPGPTPRRAGRPKKEHPDEAVATSSVSASAGASQSESHSSIRAVRQSTQVKSTETRERQEVEQRKRKARDAFLQDMAARKQCEQVMSRGMSW